MPLPYSLASLGCFGTLIDAARGRRAALSGFGCLQGDAARIEAAAVRIEQLEREACAGPYRAYEALLAELVRRACAEATGAAPEPAEVKAFVEGMGAWPPFPGSADALRRLGNRLPLAVISNAGKRPVRAALDALGVPVGLIVASDDVRSFKPAAGHWHGLVAATKLSAESMLQLSADWPRDLVPARALGMAVGWLERAGAAAPPGPPPEHAGASLGALVDSVLARDVPYAYDPAWEALPYPPQYLLGIRLFNERQYYEAHEVWEEKWQQDKGRAGEFYRGLIQFAVATLHWERGNVGGARTLFEEARRRMAPFAPTHQGLDVLGFLDTMDDYFQPLWDALRANRPAPAPDTAHAPQIELADD